MIFLLLQSSIYVHHIMYQQVYQYVLLWKKNREIPRFSSVAQSGLTLPAHGLQHSRLPSPPPSPRVYSNPCSLSWWFHPIISSSVISFSSCLQSFPASWSFLRSQFFALGAQSIGASASVLPMNIQDLLAVQGTLRSFLQCSSSKASIPQCSAFFMVQLSHPYMTTGETIALTRWTFVGKVMSLPFNMLSSLVIAFLPRSKRLLISWPQSPSAVIFGAKEDKVCHCCHCFPIYLPWSDGTGCHDLCFFNVGF